MDNGVDGLGKTCGIPTSKFLNLLVNDLYIGCHPVHENWCGVSCRVAISGVLSCVGMAPKGCVG